MFNYITLFWNNYDNFIYGVLTYMNNIEFMLVKTSNINTPNLVFLNSNSIHLFVHPDDILMVNSRKLGVYLFEYTGIENMFTQVKLFINKYVITADCFMRYFSNLLNSVIVLYIFFLVTLVLLSNISPNYTKRILNSINEQDIIIMDDFSIVYFILVWLVLFNIGAIIFSYSIITIFKKVFLFQILFLTTLTTLIPLTIVIQCGFGLLFYIKGSLKKNKILVSFLEDAISLMTFCSRFYLQTCRWLLIFTMVFLLHEFYYDISWAFKQSCILFTSNRTNEFTMLSAIYTFIDFIRNVVEYVDVIFIFIVQVLAFFAVLFWLLCFLFSTTIRGIYEYFFK